MATKAEIPWEQMAQALLSLSGWDAFSLKLREDGTWYVRTGIHVRDGGCLSSPTVSSTTPVQAIIEYWKEVTSIKPEQYLVVNAGGKRRSVRWNGFMWADADEPTPQRTVTACH
jgi:hypothetical protein